MTAADAWAVVIGLTLTALWGAWLTRRDDKDER